MRRLRARLGLAQAAESGFTLIELLVTMIVFGLAMTMVTKAVSKVEHFAGDAQGSADANGEVRLALDDIDRQVRSGNVLYSPANETTPSSCSASGTDAGTCMRVYTQANGVQRCVQWQVLADPSKPTTSIIRSRSWSPTWQTDGITTEWATKARGLLLTPSTVPFTLQGAVTSSSSRYLSVRFEAKDPRRPGAVVLTSALSGRNTNYGYDAGLCSPVPPTS
ncbi:MAG: prepilin-type N-terminal cleavage/methylation domain-containing protein [Actinomycetota bacterium]|nr:prepilin-type N-terminal cleavage/methylation domain-containing protein [Actinomycetota bacterium]